MGLRLLPHCVVAGSCQSQPLLMQVWHSPFFVLTGTTRVSHPAELSNFFCFQSSWDTSESSVKKRCWIPLDCAKMFSLVEEYIWCFHLGVQLKGKWLETQRHSRSRWCQALACWDYEGIKAKDFLFLGVPPWGHTAQVGVLLLYSD